MWFNSLKAELNPICHLLALSGAHHILHISRIRVKLYLCFLTVGWNCISGTVVINGYPPA